jgi:molybdopterin converting factor subunit 1
MSGTGQPDPDAGEAVHVLFFASLRERMGCGDAYCSLSDTTTVRDLWSALRAQHACLGEVTGTVRFVVNREFVGEDYRLSPGDEVAFIPPVSGG